MYVIVCAVVVLAAGTGVWLWSRHAGREKVTLETAAATRITISNSVTATGTVEPVTEVEVGTQVSGIIDKLYVDYNDVVEAGQLIAEMDKVTLQAELESAEAQLASCKTEYEYQQKSYARTKALYDKQLVSDAEYDESLYLYEKARNAYAESRAAMVKVKRNLGYATITSPISGVVISRAVEEGQTVAAGFETPTLFTIAKDLTEMQVIADVDEADIGQVATGQRVQFSVDAYPDDVFEGAVRQVRLEATTESNVVTYEVGLTATITIFTLERPDALSVPTRALRFVPHAELLEAAGFTLLADGGTDSTAGREVWVKQGTQLVSRRVQTGAVSGDRTEVLSGLAEGEEVVCGLTAAAEPSDAAPATERSPFMPGPPGR